MQLRMSSQTLPSDASSQSSSDARAARRADDGALSVVIFVILIGALLYAGWTRRSDDVVNPEHGLGYALGIAGGVMMLALLLYPLRKRLKFMRSWGRVAFWFRLHMVLGVLGPTLVVLHSDFTLKSLNASVAFFSMLIVAGSGIVGRYLYSRVHRGLYGGKLEARELIAEAQDFHLELGDDLRAAAWKAEFAQLEREAMHQAPGLPSAIGHAAKLASHAGRSQRAFRREFEAELDARATAEAWTPRERRHVLAAGRARIATYHAALRRVGALGVYERLFAAWHVLHLPLFFMLIITALIHVVAVHLY